MTMTFWVILITEKQNFHYLAAKFNKKRVFTTAGWRCSKLTKIML